MLTVALIRHGKTSGNLRGAFMGSQDFPLDPLGREELAALPYTLPEAEAVFSSPLKRCRETAAILYPDHAAVTVNDLRERFFGEFEGLTHGEIIKLPGYEGWGMNEAGMNFPGGEEKDDFLRRVTAAFRGIAARCEGEGLPSAAIVTHGGVIMALMSELCPPRRSYFDWGCQNGGGYLVGWEEDRIHLLRRLEA